MGATAVRSRDDHGDKRARGIPRTTVEGDPAAARRPDRRPLPEPRSGQEPGLARLDVDKLDEIREDVTPARIDECEPVAGGRPGETVEPAPPQEEQSPSTVSVGVDDRDRVAAEQVRSRRVKEGKPASIGR